jgi:hypothetical protein
VQNAFDISYARGFGEAAFVELNLIPLLKGAEQLDAVYGTQVELGFEAVGFLRS